MRDISRRQFLKYLGAGAIGAVAWPRIPFAKPWSHSAASNVVQCFHENVTSGTTVDQAVLQTMIDSSIKSLTGRDDLGDAWKSIFPRITENSVISIKVNCINSGVPTRPELVSCIVNGLTQMEFAGAYYRRNRIIIWDRSDGELSRGGYTIYDGDDQDTVRCFGTNHSGVGYDYDWSLDVAGQVSHPSKIFTSMSDYVINAAVLKNHSTSVVTLTMKNHYGSVNNPGALHGGQCNPYLPSLNQQIRDVLLPTSKQKIFMIDGLWGCCSGGPSGPANCNPKKLILSTDTVACDYQGQVVINEERAAHGWSPVDAPHIATASEPPYDLGTTDINLIEINNPTSVEEADAPQREGESFRISPNPFRSRTLITFSLPHASSVALNLIDPAGRVESRIYRGRLAGGQHRVEYRPSRQLPSGTYFVRLIASDKIQTRKITVLN